MAPPDLERAAAWVEELAQRGQRPGPYTLDLIETILERLGNPQAAVPSLHVAGTRGKGSTCALLSAALHEAGIPVGLSTSPHLIDVKERIRIAERDIDEQSFLAQAAQVMQASAGLEPSYFEALIALSFLSFAEAGLSLSVMEVGLGGRLDASTACRPLVTGISRLGLEHRDRLGDSLGEIAGEKAGIAKRGVPLVLSPNDPEAVRAVAEKARERGARLRLLDLDDLEAAPLPGLAGEAQRENAALAWTMLRELDVVSEGRFRVTREQAERGMTKVRWAGRLQHVPASAFGVEDSVDQLLDVSHDPVGIAALAAHLASLEAEPSLVFTCLQGKELPAIAAILGQSDGMRGRPVFVPELQHPRARPASEVVTALRLAGVEARAEGSVELALRAAKTRARGAPGALVVAFGTFAVTGEALRLLEQAQR